MSENQGNHEFVPKDVVFGKTVFFLHEQWHLQMIAMTTMINRIPKMMVAVMTMRAMELCSLVKSDSELSSSSANCSK